MSVIKLTITEDHIKLIKQLRWSLNSENHIVAVGHDGVDNVPPFGENNLYEAINLILNGLPKEFTPFSTEDEPVYSDEQKVIWDKLYEELPMVLDVIMFNGDFQTGTYKTKFHDRVWKKLSV